MTRSSPWTLPVIGAVLIVVGVVTYARYRYERPAQVARRIEVLLSDRGWKNVACRWDAGSNLVMFAVDADKASCHFSAGCCIGFPWSIAVNSSDEPFKTRLSVKYDAGTNIIKMDGAPGVEADEGIISLAYEMATAIHAAAK